MFVRSTMCFCLALLSLGAMTLHDIKGANAQQTSTSDLYAKSLGDGLRLYTESDYPNAVKHLFHAYAAKPKASTLAFIIRSYDLMGHCSAVKVQMALLTQAHPQSKKPMVQRCGSPATLTIDCDASLGALRLTNYINTTCGQSVLVPAGSYMVKTGDGAMVKKIALTAGQARTVKLERQPQKWPKAAVAKRATPRRYNLKRIEDPKRYTMTLSADGLYEIWIPRKNGPPVCGKKSDGERVCGIPNRTIVIPRLD